LVEELILACVREQERDSARVDEAVGGVGGDGLFAGAALRRVAALDHSELALGERRRGRAPEGNVHAEPMVVARVLECDADSDERLACAKLSFRHDVYLTSLVEARRPVGGDPPWPAVAAGDLERA